MPIFCYALQNSLKNKVSLKEVICVRFFNWRWWLGMKPKIVSGPAKDYSITVVIPAYNEESSLAATIQSVKNQTVPISEVIVVDDYSSDKTGEVAKTNGAKVIRTPVNQGTKAMAQNYVINEVKTDLLVTIDADTILDEDAILKTLPYFNDPKTVSVCGFVIPQKIETLWERGRFIEYVFGLTIFKTAQNNIGSVLVSSGCFSVFRTGILKKLGGFKARTMAEDMDFTWEATLNGYHVYCVQDSYCYPLDPSTGSIFRKQIKRWYASFFQNISAHKSHFRKKARLGAMVYGYLLEGIVTPFLMIFSIFLLTRNAKISLLMFVVVDVCFVAIPCVIKGIKMGMFWKVIASLPSYFLIRPVNFFMFWQCFWNEWVVGKKLSSWDKGH